MDRTIDDLLRLFNRLERDLVSELPKISDEMALNFNALAQNELRTKGIKGKQYSNKLVPAYFLRGKELNAAGKAYLDEANLDDDLVNWKELRAAQGLQVSYIDLTYSGRMLQGTQIVGRQKGNQYSFYSIIGGFDRETINKLRWNHDRFGDFLNPNESDKKKVKDIPQIRIKSVIDRVLFNK